MKNKKIHYAWFVLIGVILIRGFSGGGINTSIGLFLTPVAEDIGVGVGTLSLYLSIMSIATVAFLPLAGKIINKYDVRIVAVAGGILQGIFFAACGLLTKVWGWYILAVPIALGATILTNLLGPILINRWFIKNKGLIMGIQMAFVGVFGAVIQPTIAGIIENQGWRKGYLVLGLATFAVATVSGIAFIRNSPKEMGIVPYGEEEIEKQSKATSSDRLQITEEAALKSISFYMLLLFMIAVTGVGVFNQYIPTYGILLGFSGGQTGIALSFTSAGTAIGSIIIGIICDKIGSLKTCYIMIATGIITMVGFWFSENSIFLFFTAAFLHGLVSSGTIVLTPILTLEFYGERDYEKIFAKVSMGAPIASIALIPIYGYIYDFTKGYDMVLIFIVILLILAAVCISLGWKKRCTSRGCPTWHSR